MRGTAIAFDPGCVKGKFLSMNWSGKGLERTEGAQVNQDAVKRTLGEPRSAYRRALSAATLAGFVIATAAAGADRTVQTPSIFGPASTPAHAIRELALIVFGITGVIFLVVAGLTVYALMRFRRRRGDDGREPPQVYGSRQIELAWTVVPILIVVVHGPVHLRDRAAPAFAGGSRGHDR